MEINQFTQQTKDCHESCFLDSVPAVKMLIMVTCFLLRLFLKQLSANLCLYLLCTVPQPCGFEVKLVFYLFIFKNFF